MEAKILVKIADRITSSTPRSAWDKGVKLYALDLLDSIEERATYEGREPRDRFELRAWALSGARDWHEYSEGGCSLIYDEDIAKRLCSPSELRRVKGGKRRPNGFVKSWLGVQAKALDQADMLLHTAYAFAVADLAAEKEVA